MLGGGLPLHHYTEKNLEFPSFHCWFKSKVSSIRVWKFAKYSWVFQADPLSVFSLLRGLTDSVVSCVTDLKLCKNNTMGKSNFWRNILISSDFMRYLALQSIVQFSKLNIYLHTLQKEEEKLCEYEVLQKLFYPMLNISRKRNFLLMFFTNPLGWGVRDGERIRMVFNGPPSIYIQSP